MPYPTDALAIAALPTQTDLFKGGQMHALLVTATELQRDRTMAERMGNADLTDYIDSLTASLLLRGQTIAGLRSKNL